MIEHSRDVAPRNGREGPQRSELPKEMGADMPPPLPLYPLQALGTAATKKLSKMTGGVTAATDRDE
jgi:hypothetical protein